MSEANLSASVRADDFGQREVTRNESSGDCLASIHHGVSRARTNSASDTAAAGKTTPTLINVPHAPGQWQKMQLDYTAPEGVRSISVQVVANGQAPGAKLWIDDFLIGRYVD